KLPGDKFLATRQTNRRPPIYVGSITLPRSPVSLSSGDEVPRIFTRKSRLQPGEFLITSAKRLLQHNRHFSDLGRCPTCVSAKWAKADIGQVAVTNRDFMSTRPSERRHGGLARRLVAVFGRAHPSRFFRRARTGITAASARQVGEPNFRWPRLGNDSRRIAQTSHASPDQHMELQQTPAYLAEAQQKSSPCRPGPYQRR